MIALPHWRALMGAALCCAPLMAALSAESGAASPAALASPEFQTQTSAAVQAQCLSFRLNDPAPASLLAAAGLAPPLLAAAEAGPGRGAPPPANRLNALRQRSTAPVQLTGPVTTSSDQLTANANGTITMSGNVDVREGDREMQADQITYDRNTNEMNVSGQVRFQDPTVQILGDAGHYGNEGAQFSHAQFQFLTHPGRGRAQELQMTPTHVVTLNNLFYTSCPANHTDWDIRAHQMRLDTAASRGVVRGAIVDFKGVPIVYLPYLSFPLSSARQSGVLFPIVGTSTRDGVIIGVPWYWNIAPNQDATFTPTEYTSRGTDLGVEYRFLSRNDSGTLTGDYLPYDSKLHTERSFVKLVDRLDLPSSTRLQIDMENVSDDQYFEDFTQGVQSTATAFLPHEISLTHRDELWSASLGMRGYQTLDYNLPIDERPYQELPRLAASARWSPTSLPWLHTGFDGEVINFSRTSCALAYCLSGTDGTATVFPAGVGVSGWRLDASPEIGLDFSAPGYFLRPTLAWQFTQYELRDLGPPVSAPGAPPPSGLLLGGQPLTAGSAGIAGMYGSNGGPVDGFGSPWVMPVPYPGSPYALAPGALGRTLPPSAPWTPQQAGLAAGGFPGGALSGAPSRNLPIFTLDSGLTFDRVAGAAHTITLEPRAMYVYIPYRNQNSLPLFDTGMPDPNLIELFRANRYVGLDRIGDTDEFTLGLTTELFSSATGTRFVSASIGQSYFLSAPRVSLPGQTLNPDRSNLIGEINVAAFHDWNALLDVASNAEVSRIQEVQGEVQYRINGNRVINFGYQYYQGLFQQVDASTAWPIQSHWDLYGRVVYSLLGGSAIEEFAGFQYLGACWGVRALWHSSLATRTGARDTGVMLQLELTGLSNVGSQVDTFLEQSIRGYSSTPNGRVMNTPFSP